MNGQYTCSPVYDGVRWSTYGYYANDIGLLKVLGPTVLNTPEIMPFLKCFSYDLFYKGVIIIVIVILIIRLLLQVKLKNIFNISTQRAYHTRVGMESIK